MDYKIVAIVVLVIALNARLFAPQEEDTIDRSDVTVLFCQS